MRLTDAIARPGYAHGIPQMPICINVQHNRPRSAKVSRPDGSKRFRTHAEPNWDDEMSLFRKRVNSPNQMETMRKIEAEVEVGKVLYTGQGIAIVEGLNNDAPIGTKLTFVSGAAGVLLWRRSDNLCYVLLLGGQPGKGEGVVCKVKAIIQILDESKGPTTKRDYDVTTVPVGPALTGRCTDFLGRLSEGEGGGQLGGEAQLPLFNEQATMEDREQIMEALVTGVKAVDVLTPIGRGQAQLVTGLPGSGKTALVLDAILGQKGKGVQCVYAAVGQSEEEASAAFSLLESKGALQYTSMVAASSQLSLGERYAALCSACSRGEAVRDAGGHALVVLDDIRCLIEMWEHITEALVTVVPAAQLADSDAPSEEGAMRPEELVNYEGMLVSAAAAQRRQ